MFSKLAILASVGALSAPAMAKVFLTVPEAMAQAFPSARKCAVKTETHYLTTEQMKRARDLAGFEIPSALVIRYVGECDGKPAGHAYTETHRIRTHPETLWIVVSSAQKIDRIEVLSFDEPLEYQPKPAWYDTFKDRPLSDELQIKRQIPFVTGASLSGRATLEAARRSLAIDQVIGQVLSPADKRKTR